MDFGTPGGILQYFVLLHASQNRRVLWRVEIIGTIRVPYMDDRYSVLAAGGGEARDCAKHIALSDQLGHHTIIRRRRLAVFVNDVVLAVHDENRGLALWKCERCHRRTSGYYFRVRASRFHAVAQISNFNPLH